MFKNILLGVGITLITIALILMVTDTHFLLQEPKLTNDNIIKKARKLGMSFPGQDYYQNNAHELGLKRKTTLSLPKPKTKPNKSVDSSPITIQIPSGISSRKAAELLLEKNLIKDKKTFIKLLTKCNLENKIMAGRYEFNPNISSLQVVLTLTAK